MGRKAAIEKFPSKLKKLVNSLKAGENGLGIWASPTAKSRGFGESHRLALHLV